MTVPLWKAFHYGLCLSLNIVHKPEVPKVLKTSLLPELPLKVPHLAIQVSHQENHMQECLEFLFLIFRLLLAYMKTRIIVAVTYDIPACS